MYLWLCLSISAASLYSILLHGYPANEKGNIFKLNLFASLSWIVLLFIFNKCTVTLNKEILLWGVGYGIVQALFVLFKAKAMNAGSVSVTTLVGNASLLVSIVFSCIVWGEKISIADVFGLFILFLGIVLSTYSKNYTDASKRWKYYALVFFLLAAAVGIIFKGFGKSSVSDHTGDMLLVSAVVMTFFYFCTICFTKDKTIPFSKKKFLVVALAAGILSCLYNRLNITLSSSMDAVIFFPAFNGGVVILSGVLSGLIFKEKLSKKQWIGFSLGLLAIFIIGVF